MTSSDALRGRVIMILRSCRGMKPQCRLSQRRSNMKPPEAPASQLVITFENSNKKAGNEQTTPPSLFRRNIIARPLRQATQQNTLLAVKE